MKVSKNTKSSNKELVDTKEAKELQSFNKNKESKLGHLTFNLRKKKQITISRS